MFQGNKNKIYKGGYLQWKMQKKLLIIFSLLLITGIIAMHAPLLKADNDSGSTHDSNSTSVNSSNDSSHEDETHVNDSEDNETHNEEQVQVHDNGEVEIEIERDGQHLKIHARGLTPEQIRALLQERNRLRLHQNDSELPDNCTRNGSTLKCFLNGTRTMTVTAGRSGNVIVQVKGVNMSTNVTLYKRENGTVYGIFGNETRPIELPDQIKERIRERIRARLADNESNITLHEDGNYTAEVRKQARFLFLLPVKERVQLKIRAETGAILEEHNPWWGFLARDVSE